MNQHLHVLYISFYHVTGSLLKFQVPLLPCKVGQRNRYSHDGARHEDAQRSRCRAPFTPKLSIRGGQLHAPVALPPKKKSAVPVDEEAEGAAKPHLKALWTLASPVN